MRAVTTRPTISDTDHASDQASPGPSGGSAEETQALQPSQAVHDTEQQHPGQVSSTNMRPSLIQTPCRKRPLASVEDTNVPAISSGSMKKRQVLSQTEFFNVGEDYMSPDVIRIWN